MPSHDKTTEQIRFQAQLLDSARESIVATDLHGRVIYWSKGAAALYGYSAEEALGRSISFVVPPENESEVFDRVEEVRRTGSCAGEYVQLRKDGTTFLTDTNISLVYDADGQPCGLIGIDRDITHRKQAEESLRRAHDELERRVEERTADLKQALAELQELHDIVNRSPAVVFRWRLAEGWPVEFVSENVRQFGYSAEEFCSGAVSWPGITHPEDVPRLSKEVENYLLDGATQFNQEYRLITRAGEVRWVNDWNQALTNDAGEVTHIQGIVLDVTERKQTQDALRKAEEQARAVFEATTDCVLVWDRDYNYLYANQAAIDHVGATRDNVIGKNIRDGFGHLPEFMELWMRRVDQVFSTGEPMQVEDAMQVGKRFVYSESVLSPIVDSRGEMFAVGVVYRDVTERKQAEETVRRSEEKYRTLAEKVNDIPYAVDAHGLLTYVGPQMARYGRTPEEMIGRNFLEFIDPRDRQRMTDEFQRTITTGKEFPSEFRLHMTDGRVCWLEDEGRLQHDDAGRPIGIAGILRDVTERRQMANALRESEALLRKVLDLNPACIFIKNRRGLFLLANQAVAEFYGTTPDAMLGRRASEFCDPSMIGSEKLDKFLHDDQEVIRSKKLKLIPEESLTASDGTERCYQTMKIPLAVKGDPHCVLAVAVDITARKRAERTILEEQHRLRRLLSMYERDRQLVAYEIHDGLAQPLTAALMQLESGLQKVVGQQPELVPDSCHNAIALLRHSIDEARRMMGGLRPSVLDEFGVVAAVENLIDEKREETQAEIEFVVDVDFDRLESPLELVVFRIVQEALTNAVRYSRSKRIRVALNQRDSRLHMEVEDWGIGFDPARIELNRFGLEGIRVRTQLFGGKTTIRSSPGHGTAVIAEVPLVEGPAPPSVFPPEA